MAIRGPGQAGAVTYAAADATTLAFHTDKALVRGLRGPRGSSKSSASVADAVRGAFSQNETPRRIRRSKFLVLRDTYRQLETTTIPTFRRWLGPVTRLTGQYPIHGFTKMPGPDGSTVEMETIFLAMDGENIIDNLQSFEASFAWINEARAIENRNIVNMVISSTGRFPPKEEEGCPNRFVTMDTNPPDEYHWWYDADMVNPVEGWRFFSQVAPLIYHGPAGVFLADKSLYTPNPLATYARIQNAGYDYWLDMIPGATDTFIRTMVMGMYGTLVTGKPVYDGYWHEDLVSQKPIEIHEALTVAIGIDTSGLHPGAVFAQMAGGRVNLLRELHVKDIPFDEFIEAALIPFVMQHFPRNPIVCSVDPSNPRLGVGGKTALQLLTKSGFQAQLASSNRFNVRYGAVVYLLQRRGALAIDPSCKMTIEGFRGKYHYKKMDTSGLIVAHRPTPEKNDYSDCYVAGTDVSTRDGKKAIESLLPGDMVRTPAGLRRITGTMSRPAQELRRVKLTNGVSFTCTSGHRLMTTRGWVKAEALQYGDLLSTESTWGVLAQSISRQWSAIASATFSVLRSAMGSCSYGPAATTRAGAAGTGRSLPCIVISGGGVEVLSLQGTTSTTSMAMARTTPCRISNALRRALTSNGTRMSASKRLEAALNLLAPSPPPRRPQNGGTGARRAGHGTENTPQKWLERPSLQNAGAFSNAPTADADTRDSRRWPSADSVGRPANRPAAARAAWTTRIASAWSAARTFASAVTRSKNVAVESVVAVAALPNERVYDLTVEEAHCFYAEGVLAHNCHDGLQYLALYYRDGRERVANPMPQKKVLWA